MSMSKFGQMSLFTWFRNVYSSLKYDSHKDVLELRSQLRDCYKEIDDLQHRYYVLSDRLKAIKDEQKIEEVLRYYLAHSEISFKYKNELEYLDEMHEVTPFPYKKIKQLENIEYGTDEVAHLHYVVHKGKNYISL